MGPVDEIAEKADEKERGVSLKEDMNREVVMVSDGAVGGAAAGTARLLAGLERVSPGMAEWWHFSPGSVLTDGLPTRSLDDRLKRPPFERVVKNLSRSFADRLRQVRHRGVFHEAVAATSPAVLNFHNIHSCGLNHEDLLKLPPGVPVVWTMHDCWSFQPRAFEWENRVSGETEFLCEDRPEPAAKRRREIFFSGRKDVALVTPSRWLGRLARQAVGPEIRIELIPYGIDHEVFRPLPMEEVRARLAISREKVWIGIAATHAYSRKGLDVLARALHRIDVSAIGLLSWGQKPELSFPAGLEVRSLGTVSVEEEIAGLYSACDLFVCPSRCDNLPNTVLECLACGVPVIGSDVGGIPDMVRPGETGWVFASDDAESCAAMISEALSGRRRWPEMKARCREVAISDYSPALQARRYLELYEDLMGKCRR